MFWEALVFWEGKKRNRAKGGPKNKDWGLLDVKMQIPESKLPLYKLDRSKKTEAKHPKRRAWTKSWRVEEQCISIPAGSNSCKGRHSVTARGQPRLSFV